MQRRERQLILRLDTGHADHATASGPLHQELKQCRLGHLEPDPAPHRGADR